MVVCSGSAEHRPQNAAALCKSEVTEQRGTMPKKDPTADMTEEERVVYLQQKAQAEEEAARKKEELLTLFLKVTPPPPDR